MFQNLQRTRTATAESPRPRWLGVFTTVLSPLCF